MEFCFECLGWEVDYEYSLQYPQQTPKNHAEFSVVKK